MLNHAQCPCCGQSVFLPEQEALIAQLGPEAGLVPKKLAALAIAPPVKVVQGNQERLRLYWACNACLAGKRAMKADVTKQKFKACEPYYAYFDEELSCQKCRKTFVFTRQEQKHWYERLGFWVWSRPVNCKACSRKKKTPKDK
jgi:hypothetical protein